MTYSYDYSYYLYSDYFTDKKIFNNKYKKNKAKNTKRFSSFYPSPDDLKGLPEGTMLLKIAFTLEKPYTSKDDKLSIKIIEDNNEFKAKFEDQIVRDRCTNLPMVRPSTWKGNLRFAAEKVGWNNKEEKKDIITRLFGNEPSDKHAVKGILYFYPTFFKENSFKDVITPLKRDTRTPARGPISLEVINTGAKGEFYVLYAPFMIKTNLTEEQLKNDIQFLVKTLKLMFHKYGFSAKKTSGFGIVKNELTVECCFSKNMQCRSYSSLNELEEWINNNFKGFGEE